MPAAPPELQDLLQASGAAARDEAWARFVARFSPLLLHTSRAVAREHDRAMDAYAHLLEQLRQDDSRRLQQFLEDSGAQFTTWLVIVARHLCIDFLRQRYGRAPAAPSRMADHAMRRRLDASVTLSPSLRSG
jgi:DNA-directed RNA polymerase specialized sigma24 family protein